MSGAMSALFLGHGNPLNAIGDNAWARGWAAIGAALPRSRRAGGEVSFAVEGIEGGSVSMLAVRIG